MARRVALSLFGYLDLILKATYSFIELGKRLTTTRDTSFGSGFRAVHFPFKLSLSIYNYVILVITFSCNANGFGLGTCTRYINFSTR
ncbi:hypothetical protein DFH27DRAFT_535302 [Peziza echinospora]|nr:hypothetical protein DFH27DRAFT_535302 [Peziza echinospora]